MTVRHLATQPRATYDAVIVGGGPAGLSAALVLGRANKRVLVVDNDRPANAVSQGVGGLLGHDRVKPADLRIKQVADLVEVKMIDRDAKQLVLPKSEVLKREAFTVKTHPSGVSSRHFCQVSGLKEE